jgi:hypothetical protein
VPVILLDEVDELLDRAEDRQASSHRQSLSQDDGICHFIFAAAPGWPASSINPVRFS